MPDIISINDLPSLFLLTGQLGLDTEGGPIADTYPCASPVLGAGQEEAGVVA